MVLTDTGLAKVFQRIKSFVIAQLNSKASAIHTHTKSDIIDLPNGYVVDSTLDGTSSNAIANSTVKNALDGKSDVGHTHTKSDITDFPTLATVATSGSYNDLSNKPVTMTPTSHTHGNITNDGKIGSNANKPLITTTNGVITTGSFGTTANTFCQGNDSRLSDARAPTAHTHSASDITSGLATVATSGSYNDLSNKPTIPTVNNATLTIQKNGSTVKTFTANQSTNATANIIVPTKTSDLTNDSGFITSDNTKIPLAGSNAISGSLKPATTNAYDLGGSSYQWNNAYIKSLTISDSIINKNEQQFIFNKEYSDATDNWLGIHTYLDKNHTRLGFHAIGDFSGNRGFRWFVRGQSTNSVETDIFGFGRKWNETSYMYINATLETDLIPADNNSKSLGSSTNKWKTLNGIAPDELGLPTSTYTDVSSYITNFDSTANTFTAPVSGLLYIHLGVSNSVVCAILNNTKGYGINLANSFGTIRGLFPVEKGDSISVYITESITIGAAQIIHLKGKV